MQRAIYDAYDIKPLEFHCLKAICPLSIIKYLTNYDKELCRSKFDTNKIKDRKRVET